MNLNFDEVLCPTCRTQTMESAGATFGGRISFVKIRCSFCEQTLLIVPMKKELEYCITATTEDERKEEAIKKVKEEIGKRLEKEIELINKSKL